MPETGTVANDPAKNNIGGAIGDCNTDQFQISASGGSGSPVICGINTGYHSKFDS